MSDTLKLKAARRAVEYVRDGMVIGLGSGSTAELAISVLGERARNEALELQCVPTSEASGILGREMGLHIQTLEDCPVLDLTIDGADEVDPQLELVKGLGGALLREKIVAAASTREIIIIDDSKLVPQLGTRALLPVEVIPFAWTLAQRQLMEIARTAELRRRDDGEPYVTDNGNFILDCGLPDGIHDPAQLDADINRMPSVVENGLFVGLAHIVIVAEIGADDCRIMERS